MMTKFLRPLSIAFMLLSVYPALSLADSESISPDSDLSRLQGKWMAQAGLRRQLRVSLDIQGRRVAALVSTPHGLNLRAEGELKIDESVSPRTVDWIKFNGPDQQELPSILGIYKLDRDTFVVCTGGFNGDRPSEFKPGEGVLTEVVTFRRPTAPLAEKSR